MRSTDELWRELLQRRERRERIARAVYIALSATLIPAILIIATNR